MICADAAASITCISLVHESHGVSIRSVAVLVLLCACIESERLQDEGVGTGSGFWV